jgi:dolichyl-phosphate beta-glucosyltransferase
MEKMDVSIVIPAYNEETRIIPTLEKVYRYFTSREMEFEIIVADDGSKDNTVQVVNKFSERYHGIRVLQHKQNKGKGAAVKTGVLDAKGDLILFTDADLSTPIEEFEKLKKAIDEGFDIAIGSRGLPDSKIVVSQPWYRRYIGKVFPYLVRLIVMRDFKDTQCGFKLFRKEAGRTLFSELKTEGFAFDVEILYRAIKNGYKVVETSITWFNSLQSKVGLVHEPFRMLRAIFKLPVLYSRENKAGENEKSN